MIRVILVDERAEVRTRLRTILAAHLDIEVVGEAEHGGQALHLIAERQPDVVLMNVFMPVVNSVAVTRHIRAHYPDVQIILWTPFFNDTVVEGLRAGATSYLQTDANTEEIYAAIRSAFQGPTRHLPPSATSS